MSTKYVCDRCDKVTEDKKEILTIAYPAWQQYNRDLGDWPIKHVDFCASCIRDLNEFMKPLPKRITDVDGSEFMSR